MNRKGPWEGYRRQAKRRLARCLLPAFLCAHIFIKGETSGYEAAQIGSSADFASQSRYKAQFIYQLKFSVSIDPIYSSLLLILTLFGAL